MISAHGTLVYVNGIAVNELGDTTPPSLIRDAIEDTRHIAADDAYEPGRPRYGDLMFEVGYLATVMETLLDAWANDDRIAVRVEFPDGSEWSFDGFVIEIAPRAPVDDKLTASVVIRPTGVVLFDPQILLQEDGFNILQENGSRLIWS